MIRKGIIANRDGQFYIKKAELSEEEIRNYRSELGSITQKSESKFQLDKISVWTEIKDYVRLPRLLGLKDFPEATVKLQETKVLDSWTDSSKYVTETLWPSLYSYQIDAVSAYKKALEDRKLGGIIKFGCGRGKTRTALVCAAINKKKTLVICNGDTPCNSFEQEIKKTLGNIRYSMLTKEKKADRKKVLLDPEIPIILSCYKTIVYPGNFEPEDFHCIDLTIMDEVHEYLTEKSLEVFQLVSRNFIIGLSATPSKANGLHFLLDYFVGPIMIECKNLYEGALPEVHKIYCPVQDDDGKPLKFEKGTTYQKVQDTVQSGKHRQDLIVNQVIKYYRSDSNNKILVIGIMRELLEKYKKAIESVLSEDTCALYYAVTTKKEKEARDVAIQEKRVILAIRQMGGQSLNIPDLNIMILASKYIPKNDGENTEKIEQLCGRVLRKKHQKSPIIVDIVDKHFYFLKHDRLCTEYYENCGFKVIGDIHETCPEPDERDDFDSEFA